MDEYNIENPQGDEKAKTQAFNDNLTRIAFQQLLTSTNFKRERMKQIQNYEEMYAGKIPKKLRQQFNVPIPILAGMVDTLLANFDEDIVINFDYQDPADKPRAEKIQACWDAEKISPKLTARWDYKNRMAKKQAIFSGRGILKYYTYSDPKYHSCLEVVDYKYFHCQPHGGGLLEKHLFAGQEAVNRTIEQLQSSVYDQEQVKKLLQNSKSKEYLDRVNSETNNQNARFRALGMDVESNNYVGTAIYQLCEWVLTYNSKRYYVLFDPWTITWVRVSELTELRPDNTLPWKSFATHEDPMVFWSKSFCDDMYPIADSVMTMFNQELTNREKLNFNARLYDTDMFPDVQKLDSAQYRPDALVPVDTKGGTRRVDQGIYSFQTPVLTGTINLIDWIQGSAGKQIGVTELSQGQVDREKRVGVVFAEQKEINKRMGLQNKSYSEMWVEIGLDFIYGLELDMTEDIAVRILGEDGYEWDYLTKDDLKTKRALEISITGTNSQNNTGIMESENKVKAVEMIIKDPVLKATVNPTVITEIILREVGKFKDIQVTQLMDTETMGSEETNAKASEVIQDLIAGKEPEKYMLADLWFLKKINRFALKHEKKLNKEGKFNKFMAYINAHAQIAARNTAKVAAKQIMEQRQGIVPPEEQPIA